MQAHFHGEPEAVPPPTPPEVLAADGRFQGGLWLLAEVDLSRIDRFLAEPVLAEAELPCITDGRLSALPMDPQRAATLRHDIDLAERVDAFVARFGRLQDMVGDMLLPGVLAGRTGGADHRQPGTRRAPGSGGFCGQLA